MVKLLNDSRKTATCHVEVTKAFFQLWGLCAGIALVDRIMPDLPGALLDMFVWYEGREDINLPLNDRSKLVRVEEVVEVTHLGGGVRG